MKHIEEARLEKDVAYRYALPTGHANAFFFVRSRPLVAIFPLEASQKIGDPTGWQYAAYPFCGKTFIQVTRR